VGKVLKFKDPQQALKDGLEDWRRFAKNRYALDHIEYRDMVIRHALVVLGVWF
jgi:hypothetical protein